MRLDLSSLKHLGLVLLLAAGGCLAPVSDPTDSEEVEDASKSDAPIIGGSVASGYPESALVDMYQGGQQTSACSGSVIAPRVVLTAGHCTYGFDGWKVTTPFANGQKAFGSKAVTYDWYVDSEYVDPNYHDIALIILDTPINLTTYPTIQKTKLADGSKIVNVGRINNGQFSTTKLYVSQQISISDGKNYGFPFDYVANEVIQSGDSGGPDFLAGTHTIVAVNSGAGGGTEVLARTDLLFDWIAQQVAANGGGGNNGGNNPPPPPNANSEKEPNDDYKSPNALSGAMGGSLTAGDQDWFTWSVPGSGVAYELTLAAAGDGIIEMWKLVNGYYYKVPATTSTSFKNTSNGAGTYVVVAYSPSGSPQNYTITLKK